MQRKSFIPNVVSRIGSLTLLLMGFLPPAATAAELVYFDVETSALSNEIEEDEARFQQRHQVRSGTSGGIERLRLQADLGGARILDVRGRALVDNHDYLLRLLLDQEDVGYVEAGFREFRHWFDASAGYFAPTNASFSPDADELAIDRGRAWFEAGLRKPDVAELTVRYERETRDGRKDALAWGNTSLSEGAGYRAIVPAFSVIDEERDRISLDVSHQVRKSRYGAAFRGERWKSETDRRMSLQPGEAAAARAVTHRESVESDLLNARAFSEHRLTRQRAIVTTAYSFTRLDNDLDGSRIYGARFRPSFDPLFPNRQAHDLGFTQMRGSANLSEHVGHLNALVLPWKGIRIRTSVRAEREDANTASTQESTRVDKEGVIPFLSTEVQPMHSDSDTGTTLLNQTVDIRVQRFRNWVLFARGDWEQLRGDLIESVATGTSAPPDPTRETKIDGFEQRYEAGAHWYPAYRVRLSAKGYYDDREIDYGHRVDLTSNAVRSPNRYAGYIDASDMQRHGAQARAQWSIQPDLRLSSTYDYLLSTIDTRKSGLARQETAEILSHAVSGMLSWSPGRSYLQGSVSFVRNETDTPADDLAGPPGKLAVVVPNDYSSAQILGGTVLGPDTDLEGLYFLYHSDNGAGEAAYTQPYGADLIEHGLRLGLQHQFSDRLQAKFHYGYVTSEDDANGGLDDYDGHILYGALRYAF